MQLGHFRLERYGPFEHLDLRFDPSPGRVNLIVAPNGYGKSVIRRALGDFLFGIEARTAMTFRFGTEKMRLLADVTQDGTTRSLVRRKGNGNTLALADGPEIPPDDTRRLLGGADATIFHELFGLDTALLRSGGQELIRSQGRLGQVLFAAGGGLGCVRDLLSELERKRDDLGRATVRHRSRPLWSALSNWEQGTADLRRAALRPDGWTALERQAAEAAQDLQALLAEQAEATRQRDHLRTIGSCRQWLDRLQKAQRILTEAADAPELDDSFEKRWREALQQGVVSAGNADAANAELRAARDDRAQLAFDPAWIAAEAEIKTLADLRGLALGAETDLPKVQRDLSADRARASVLRRDLGWDDAFALPPAPGVKDAQRRLQQHLPLAMADTAARDRREEADRQLAATLAERDKLPEHHDLAALVDLVGLLRAGGDPAVRLDTSRRKLRDAEAALRAALAAIPDRVMTQATLGATTAPSEPRLEAAGKALGDAEIAHARAVQDHADRRQLVDTEQAALAALERRAHLPSADALAQARAHRDALWRQLCAPSPDSKPAATLVALDRAIRDADAVADALIAHGQDVAEAAAIRGRLRTLQAALAKDVEPVGRAAARVTGARGDLLALAQAAGSQADDVPALRAFLRARDAAIRCRDARDRAAAELTDTERELTSLGGQLARAIGAAEPDPAAVGAVLAEADRRIDADRDLAARRKTLTEQIGKQQAACAAAATAATKADRALAAWHAQWQPAAGALARPPDETMAATADALVLIEDLRVTEQRAADNQRRVEDMLAAVALLTARVGRLRNLSPDLATLPPTEAAEALQRRSQAEHREAVRCADADRRIEQAADKRARTVAEAETAARALLGLRAALRVATDEQAEHQLRQARAVAAARADNAEAQRQLAVQGGGLAIEALAAGAAETTVDADLARISAIEASHHARAPRIEAARVAATAAAAALDQAGSGLDAAEAAQRREAAQAMLARTAEEALILHATHALLQTALDRQAAGVRQPLLTRIGEVFRTITGGAQAGVRIEQGKDGPTMVALEADGTTRKALDQLSEGTCDQLYLALRVAALEDYAATTSPLPFVADDILQTFDDPRTAATMHALLQLSERVQVIVLTHHTHVGDLAARLPRGAVQVMRLAAA